jgi:putative aminopeptidase FrvX
MRRLVIAVLLLSTFAAAQSDLGYLVSQPAVPGRELALSRWIAAQLRSQSPKIDDLGNVIVAIGSGAPYRLLVAPIDEPGFVVSRIAEDGYLQLQRLPQAGMLPLFQELTTGQPLLVGNKNGKWSYAAMAGLSVHLQPGRHHPPDMNDIENLYADLGAAGSQQVTSAGIEVLAPVALDRQLHQLGYGRMTSTAIGDRFGAAVLMQLARELASKPANGTTALAFVTQSWSGARGLQRLLNETHPDELIFLGRFAPTATAAAPAAAPGDSGVLLAMGAPDAPNNPLFDDLRSLAGKAGLKLTTQVAAPLIPRSYQPSPKLPEKTVHLSVPIWWPVTPAETINSSDMDQLARLLRAHLTGDAGQPATIPDLPSRPGSHRASAAARQPSTQQILQTLIETYGVSDHERAVAVAIQSLLPPWAKPTLDKSGNLILDWGDPSKAPDLVVVAHQDEIGYEVKTILPDGRLDLEDKGGGLLPFFEGHPIVFHTPNGERSAVLELPPDWQKPDFKFPGDRNPKLTAYLGAGDPEEVAKLGIKVGDYATVLKKYRPLLGQRATARSFDDRVGCTALIAAAWALGRDLNGRRVAFVWSTGEELGLLGAGAYARELAAQNKSPRYVFAIDTFVSSDSPIESRRFGDGILGDGFVIRAVDNSNITPLKDVQHLRHLAAAQKIPTQYGVTGGGNDGSAFVQFGTVDVPLGWPLRYSHSPAEVIDLRDIDSLARAVTAIARDW